MAEDAKAEEFLDLDDIEKEKETAATPKDNERAEDESWTESILSRIYDYATPLTERFRIYSEKERKEESDSEKEESAGETVIQKIADLATPLAEPRADTREAIDANDTYDGIFQRIADLTSPITDLIEGYIVKDIIPEQEENAFQRVIRLFGKNKVAEPTWNEKLLGTATNLISRLTDQFNSLTRLDGIDIHDLSRNQILAGIGSSLFLLLLLVLRRCRSKRDQTPANRRPRSSSQDSARARARSGSFDAFIRRNSITRDRTETSDDPIDRALKAKDDAPLAFGGPGVPSISYETWSPPMQWLEASRMLLPVNTHPEQKRNITLNFQDGSLSIEDRGEQIETFVMKDLSLHVKPPAIGGILQLYVKGAPEEQWMEHTFKSAHQAAQFQHDLINYQVVGEKIMHMYESLELIQKGSLAHDGKECVLHDDKSDTKKGFVAWDDCMRCFSGIKTVRKALETDLVNRVIGDTSEGEETAVPDDYVDTRLLLGRFDFFRLFVPNLELTALPQANSSPERVTELLERRKRVAHAALFVQGFIQARTIANKGWKLSMDLPEESFTKRLAYDEDIDNVKRDSQAKNEYYEATVSRDVRCEVHSPKHLKKKGASVLSKYQAFTLVGSHVLKLPPQGEHRPLSHRKDPVLSFPSLRKLVESHPQLDFFVCAFFPAGLEVAIVQVFVRSLPKGVDSSFDAVMDRYMNGTVEVRQRKLEVFMQLGPGARLSPLAWGALKTVSLLLSWSRRGESQIPYESGTEADRTPFPGMTMSNYMETTHFGGSLQTDTTLRNNYVSVTAHVDPSRMNAAMRVLYQRLEEGGLQASIVDFTFVLEGERVDELPERALGTIRIVHLDAAKVALPADYIASQGPMEDEESVPEETQRSSLSPLTRTLSIVWDSLMTGTTRTLGDCADPQSQEVPRTPVNGRGRDPFQVGVDALRDILLGVTVPIRRENLSTDDMSTEQWDKDACQDEPTTEGGDLVNIPVLSRVSTDDLRRFFRATGCDLKEAAVRIVESAAWRGVTFPIDTRKCRVELQSGQFFQQGRDVDGDPVFYFQNMLMGPWRGNLNASVAAILHRLESSILQLSEQDPDVRCTVIALVGKPFKRISKKKKRRKDESSVATESKDADEDGEGEQSTEEPSVASHTVDQNTWNPLRMGTNPRVYPEEDFHVHSDILMFQRLAELLPAHYPERLKRLILVPGQGRSMTYMNTTFTMRKFITSSRTRNKVIHLNRASELPKYVEDEELATLAGGCVEVIEENAFEC